METVEEPQKKIFKARKTMRTSDRQQLEVVHKAKEEFLQKQGQGVVEESGTTGAPSPAPTPPPTPSTPLVNGKHNSNENGDLEQPDSPVADKATSSPKSLSEDIQESEEMEELEPTSSGNVNQKETVESELYEDISEPSPYSESPQDARVSQSLPAKVVQEQPEEEKTTENVREVEDTNSTTIKTIEDKGNAGKLADDGSPAENKEASLESKVPEVKSVSPTPAPSPIVLLMPLEVEHRDKSPTQLEDIGDLAISSSVEGNAEDISDSLVKNKLNERNVDGETEEKASSVERLEAGSPGPSVSTTAMETETGDSEEIIPILEKLAPSSSAPLSPSSPPSEDVLSPAQSPSRQDSSDLVPREGFLVLSDEDEGEKDRMDCEEVQKDTVQSTATLPEETGSANVAEVETVEEPKTSSNLELEAEPETEVLEMSTQRKRSCSDDVEVVSEPKRRRFLEGNYEAELELKITAARADVHQKLEKIVQRILEEKIRALQWSVFDKTLEELKSRVEKIDCSKRHEAVLTGLQAKISRLSKKFGAANQAQDEARKQQEISASQADLSSGAATTTYRMAPNNSCHYRQKKYFAEDVLHIIDDAGSALSDEDFEMSEGTEESDDDNAVRMSPRLSDSNSNIHQVPATVIWEDYPEFDSWKPSWLPDFKKTHGVLVDTTNYEPVDYFKLFFPESVFELMSMETNRYAERFFNSPCKLSPHSRFSKWKPTTKEEMKGYVALQIEMGLDWRYNYREHWSTRNVSPGGFGKVMPRDRYVLLNSFLHFCDNKKQPQKGEPGYYPICKIQPLLDLTMPTYMQVYQPDRDLSVDESMVKYKGRLFFRQCMPDKPTKYGIKNFVLAEANTGYCLKIITYIGKYSFPRKDCSLTTQIVLDLLQGCDNKGHIAYMDNFYTSPDLFLELQRKGIGACGTAKASRKYMPPKLKPSNLKLTRIDKPIFVRANNLVALVWQDVKRVICLTTVHTNNTCKKVIHQKGKPERRVVNKPIAIEEYSVKVSGVDRLDQMLGAYAFAHKCMKWYHAVYHQVREVALTNGYIIYKQEKKSDCLNAANFRKKVVDGLLSEYVAVETVRQGRPSHKSLPNRLTECHFAATYENKKYKPDCIVCSNRQKKQRHQCNTYCKQCDLPMHAIGCFERYHTIQNYYI
ncbi:activating transcription factor 7-interacting protein 1 isoform X1 [Polypterus senegalus]|uniref:activating transcription factor 7-interacting protein 1 isoform X1 n=1 Tax=Polypterus senegalus TaxID=55291 RepID=UPI0019634606|nr:activating transcription factor 7-interacting protein 1 isoform X1 [Polypterus senegalus]XP_039621623.1 activating transcription factor 7-interacting protein 1 isoform X1 [Polypterus senegalus]XP_039621624.1 activating transcription factor 7-interacting protein 1 isoform X1 [Polypterus senegalus]XP_039621626.1 activating transcription factor 7-interacting protein 1 isoform X1 [Polypterus senegalus]XP_039621627.1 activating transcription factor 7-interacting protein 1 isoform X1 [Polypterus s